MSKGIPWGYYQGNRSEYLAAPALSKLGFTVPVPRQEDHFGIDYIVHLARIKKNTVIPLGRSFGIQIKSNNEPLIFEKQEERNCLDNSVLPFFLGVISRRTLTLEIYNTLSRLCFIWMKGLHRPFQIVPKSTGKGLIAPDYESGKVWTGKPILKISLKEPPTPKNRLSEILNLESTMGSWIALENEVLSLKELKVPIFYRPKAYETNIPVRMDGGNIERIAYSNPTTLPNICVAAEKTLDSLSCYLRHCLTLPPASFHKGFKELLKQQFDDVEKIRRRNQLILREMWNHRPKKTGFSLVLPNNII